MSHDEIDEYTRGLLTPFAHTRPSWPLRSLHTSSSSIAFVRIVCVPWWNRWVHAQSFSRICTHASSSPSLLPRAPHLLRRNLASCWSSHFFHPSCTFSGICVAPPTHTLCLRQTEIGDPMLWFTDHLHLSSSWIDLILFGSDATSSGVLGSLTTPSFA